MKKNVMMRLASFLLVAVLISTSAISGTYAKYTTQDSGKDEARVAKWGVELQVIGNLYGETYKDVIVADDSADGFTVQSKDAADDVVAPGTKNDEGFTFSLNGTPEVSGEVTVTLGYENIYLNAGYYGVMIDVPAQTINAANYNEFADLYVKDDDGVYSAATGYTDHTTYYTLEDIAELGATYYPVEYAMSGSTSNYNVGYTGDHSYDTIAGISAMIGEKFGTPGTVETVDGKKTVTYTGAKFMPNQVLAEVFELQDQRITWKWDFCQVEDGNSGDAACATCKADTILGNLMAGIDVVKRADDNTFKAPVAATGTEVGDYNLQTQFSIDITVTQVD